MNQLDPLAGRTGLRVVHALRVLWARFRPHLGALLALLLLGQQAALAADVAPATARIHYNRTDGTAATWQLYHWYGSLVPSPTYVPARLPSGTDAFGVYYDVPLKVTDNGLNWILHDATGSQKNCGSDMYAPFPANIATVGLEIWQLQDDCTVYTTQPAIRVGNVNQAKAHFVDRRTIALPGAASGRSYRLYAARNGGIASAADGITGGESIALGDAGPVDAGVVARFPQLAGARALRIAAQDARKVPALLRGQLVLGVFEAGRLVDATSLQLPGVLDDLYRYQGVLGATPSSGRFGLFDAVGADETDPEEQAPDDAVRASALGESADDSPSFDGAGTFGRRPARDRGVAFRLWAPTAQSVRVLVYDTPTGAATAALAMRFDERTGVWKAKAAGNWFDARRPKYYLYEVKVFVRTSGRVETNLVTDPYSLGLAADGRRSLVVDLDAPATRPRGWGVPRPRLAAPEDIVLYELHPRDFSASDATVPAADRGKFRAFTYSNTQGMAHLRGLQEAGLTHVHLLPAFDLSSVPETGCVTPAIPDASPDSPAQQAAIDPVKDRDCFNWGYDPVHYTVPDGSYASDPNGVARIVEFRDMVNSLHRDGLRVVMDVVYNHTAAGGQDANSVLDRIVPGYYHRLNAVGNIENSTCCSNTAPEHAMMGKLVIDSVLTWARDYRVDAFRFDLMAFVPLPVMQELKRRLARIDPSIYLYGEGWNFGEVANNALFVQASQLNIAGTGIGTFSDRMRDAARGGSPFDGGESLVRNQGFLNGLWTDPNALAGPPTAEQRDQLNRYGDWVRLGIAATLKDYVFTDKDGQPKTGAQIDYNGQPAGYTQDPQEVINYVSAHDNQTLFDNNQYKLPLATSLADRVRVNHLGIATVMLSQGVPFFHAGDELLRSKSLDRDSYNSGDWFNRLDFSYQTNNWGVGLPPAFTGNEPNWPVIGPLLANPALRVGPTQIATAHGYFQDMLRIRSSLPLLRLRSGADVREKLKFHNVGPAQIPGVVAFSVTDEAGRVDRRVRSIVAVINADKASHRVSIAGTQGRRLVLHPVLQASTADPIARQSLFDSATGSITVPGRTTVVFVEEARAAAAP